LSFTEIDDKEPFEILVVQFLPPKMDWVAVVGVFPNFIRIRSVEIKDPAFMAISVR